MTLRAGHYRAIQLFYDDGSPVLGPGNREVFVTRCGAELLGTRTDGGDATKNIATFLGIRRKTVAPSGPLTPVTVPGGVGTPGSGFEPGQGQIQGDGGGGLLTVGGGKLIVPEDKEVWVVKPCTRTPGPPLGPFPLGNHVATPLGVEYDDGSGPKAVYADGCVECEIPVIPPCGCYPNTPDLVLVNLVGNWGPVDFGGGNFWLMSQFYPKRFLTGRDVSTWRGSTFVPLRGWNGSERKIIAVTGLPQTEAFFTDAGSLTLNQHYSRLPPLQLPLCEMARQRGGQQGGEWPAELHLEGQCRTCGWGNDLPSRVLCTIEAPQCPCLDGLSGVLSTDPPAGYGLRHVALPLANRAQCGDYRDYQYLHLSLNCLGTTSTQDDYLFYPWIGTFEQGGFPVNYEDMVSGPREPNEGPPGQSRLVFSSRSPFMLVYEAELFIHPLYWRGSPNCAAGTTLRFTLTEAP